MLSLQKSLPAKHRCINSIGVGQAQQALLDYYTNLHVIPLKNASEPSCDLYLMQEDRHHGHISVGEGWKLIWQGKRPADKREKFRLYQKID